MSASDANKIVREVAAAVATWREVAASLEIGTGGICRMESAFEHNDLRRALKL